MLSSNFTRDKKQIFELNALSRNLTFLRPDFWNFMLMGSIFVYFVDMGYRWNLKKWEEKRYYQDIGPSRKLMNIKFGYRDLRVLYIPHQMVKRFQEGYDKKAHRDFDLRYFPILYNYVDAL